MIELKVDKFENGKVVFHIERQDIEDYIRLKKCAKQIKLDNGKIYLLQSAGYPEINNKKFFVRGVMSNYDENCITTSLNNYLNIFECIKKYNNEFC